MEQKELLKLSREFIRCALYATGLGNMAFCERLGIKCLKTLNAWLYGASIPKLEMLFRIEDISGVSPDDCGLKLHAAMACIPEMLETVRCGIPVAHISERCYVSKNALNRVIDGKLPSAILLINFYEIWTELDCANWFASDDYRQSLLEREAPNKRTRDEAVTNWILNNFGQMIANDITRPHDGVWAFKTDSMYQMTIEHMYGDKYNFRAIFKPKDRLSVERVIEIHDSCYGCLYDLGGGRDNCRLNLSYECRDGGGFEAWEPDASCDKDYCEFDFNGRNAE